MLTDITPGWRPHERFNYTDSEKCKNKIERFHTAEKISYNSCQVYSHLENESLCIYGLISVQQFYIVKYTNTLKIRL